MLQALLEDRFKLKIHRETREVPIYAVTVAKGGSKLKPFKEGSCSPFDFTKFPPPPPTPGQKLCSNSAGKKGQNVVMEAQGFSISGFSVLLSGNLDRRVIDKTGITGMFDFHLEFAPDQATPRWFQPSDDPAGSPSIFTAMQEQLGLKLEPAKGRYGEVLVIDHVEKPSEN